MTDITAAAANYDPHTAGTAPTVVVSTRPHAILTVGEDAFDPGPPLELSIDPEQLDAAAQSWMAIASDHETRQTNAELMVRQHRRTVAPVQQDASHKSQQADQADQHADNAAHERDRKTERALDAASTAVQEISRWASANADLTATPESDALDADTITQTAAAGPAALLGSASDWKDSARNIAAKTAAELRQTAKAYGQQADTKHAAATDARHRAEELRAGRMIPPRGRHGPAMPTKTRSPTPCNGKPAPIGDSRRWLNPRWNPQVFSARLSPRMAAGLTPGL